MTRLTEEDVKYRYITPAIEKANWKNNQIMMEYSFTDGQIMVRGETVIRGKRKKADYLLLQTGTNKPLAIVEAKDESHDIGYGIQQAIDYARILDVPFAYSSNGHGFVEHDFLTGMEKEISMNEFPTEEVLWNRIISNKHYTKAQTNIIKEPYFFDSFTNMQPRYYQRIAIDRIVEAVALGKKRLLLVMATGTGKTFTAFQIVWRLLKSKAVKRVLYLADRNILIDQTMDEDFKPLKKVMTKIKNKELDSSYEIYMSLYQQLAGDDNEEPFREFKPEFFDLIIVDEAHRGSAKEESQWRKILDYFYKAIHIGMTATPKETKEVSNITYFGEPIYTYSLKQGIEDGFLAPYKVIRVSLDKDLEGWRPYKGQLDIDGNEIEDREYNVKDFDKNLIIDERTQIVAKRVTQWLEEHDRFAKTIVFCVDIDHAERMSRALKKENADLVRENSNYIMRITGDNQEGKNQLYYFIEPKEKYPTIVTTSKLMTTGVNCKTVKLIVLENNINSMTEFKQIIGRGTRIQEKYGKQYFTIMDFRGVSRLFADPEFDGEPVVIIDDVPNKPTKPTRPDRPSDGNEDIPPGIIVDEPPVKQIKYHVRGVEVKILNERVQFYDNDGKLVTESLIDYSRKNILNEYATLNEFINAWSAANKKKAIIEALIDQGVFLSELRKEAGDTAKQFDDFDLILHIAYDKKPLTKKERVTEVIREGYLYKYSEKCQEVLSALLDKYMNEGINQLENTEILEVSPFDKIGSPVKIAKLFGGKQAYITAVKDLEAQIYSTY